MGSKHKINKALGRYSSPGEARDVPISFLMCTYTYTSVYIVRPAGPVVDCVRDGVSPIPQDTIMDFFHCPIKIILQNKKRSAVAASAYISAPRLENTWDDATHDDTRKRHVIYTECRSHMRLRNMRIGVCCGTAWNIRTLELALPAEHTHDQNIALIRKFVQRTFVDKGMCADVAFHDKGGQMLLLLAEYPTLCHEYWQYELPPPASFP